MPAFPNNNPPSAAFAAVHRALGQVPAEFATAGELAALMAALPPHTPVSVAETVYIDPELELGVAPNRTVAAAAVITMVKPQDSGDGLGNDPARTLPGVEPNWAPSSSPKELRSLSGPRRSSRTRPPSKHSRSATSRRRWETIASCWSGWPAPWPIRCPTAVRRHRPASPTLLCARNSRSRANGYVSAPPG